MTTQLGLLSLFLTSIVGDFVIYIGLLGGGQGDYVRGILSGYQMNVVLVLTMRFASVTSLLQQMRTVGRNVNTFIWFSDTLKS